MKDEEWNRQWAELRRKKPGARFSWYEFDLVAANEWILPALREMNQEHCCFCDGFPVAGLSSETIEHFRPKSREEFYELAYEWTNLFYCCSDCQKHKREQWDERLLKPDSADFDFDRYFMFDYTTGAVRPLPTASADEQVRAEVTIRLYGLASKERCRNRRTERRKWERTTDALLDYWAYRDFLERAE